MTPIDLMHAWARLLDPVPLPCLLAAGAALSLFGWWLGGEVAAMFHPEADE